VSVFRHETAFSRFACNLTSNLDENLSHRFPVRRTFEFMALFAGAL
jgi:hypothetical protein